MKKLIPFFTAAFAVIMMLSFVGCSARSSVSADDFKKQAEAKGFTVTDQTSSATDVSKYYVATKSDTGTEISYMLFASNSAAEQSYLTVKKSISAGVTGKTLDSATYNKYTLVNGELSHTLVRMDSTIVYAKTTASHQNEVQAFMDAIKY